MSGGPTTFSQVAPGDTAGVLSLMRLTMTQIDSALNLFERRDTLLQTAADSAPHRLTVWLQHGIPRKLTVDAPDSTTGAVPESDYWFVDGDIAVALEGTSAFALDAGRIVLWTDETLVPRDGLNDADRMARESSIRAQVEMYLAGFGVKSP